MINYRWINTKYYLNEDEEITRADLISWQHLPHTNFSNANFYFLINDFYYKNINTTNNLITSSFYNSVKNYNIKGDELNLFLNKFNFLSKDYSYWSEFFYLKNSSFIKFFINNMVDVPICFKKSKSIKSKNFELPLLKFSNFLMKKGKREKIVHVLFSSFRLFFKLLKLTQFKLNNENISWLNLYLFTNNLFWQYNSHNFSIANFSNETNLALSHENIFSNDHKSINISFFIKNYFYSLISKVSPVFSYFIYSVDKNIRKYSRGKSGKYTFIWKYVPAYKRINLSMRSIVKDVKFYQSQKFSDRLLKIFELLLNSPEKSFSWKSKIFSHNYVFKNFRKSLMSSLRTTS